MLINCFDISLPILYLKNVAKHLKTSLMRRNRQVLTPSAIANRHERAFTKCFRRGTLFI